MCQNSTEENKMRHKCMTDNAKKAVSKAMRGWGDAYLIDGFGMPAEWALSIVVPTFKRKGDIRNYRCYRAGKLFEYGMKMMKRCQKKRLCIIVYVDEKQFGFMSERGTMDAMLVLRRMQEEYYAEIKKLYMYFVDLEKALDKVIIIIIMVILNTISPESTQSLHLKENGENIKFVKPTD